MDSERSPSVESMGNERPPSVESVESERFPSVESMGSERSPSIESVDSGNSYPIESTDSDDSSSIEFTDSEDFSSAESTEYEEAFPEGMRVLIVDGNFTCLAVVAKMLRILDYEVVLVDQARVALSIICERHKDLDLVLTDIHLPDMDGLEFLENIEKQSTLPVVVMTADRNEELLIQSLYKGAQLNVEKPLNLSLVELLWQFSYLRRRYIGAATELVDNNWSGSTWESDEEQSYIRPKIRDQQGIEGDKYLQLLNYGASSHSKTSNFEYGSSSQSQSQLCSSYTNTNFAGSKAVENHQLIGFGDMRNSTQEAIFEMNMALHTGGCYSIGSAYTNRTFLTNCIQQQVLLLHSAPPPLPLPPQEQEEDLLFKAERGKAVKTKSQEDSGNPPM